MASSPENIPLQDSELEAEKPRTGAVILATRTHIGKLLNESLTNERLGFAEIINNSRKDRSKLASIRYRYWLEYGKEDALRYALHHKSNLEGELNLEGKITTDDYLQHDPETHIKTPQEIVEAGIVISKCVDLAYSESKWHGIDTNRRIMDKNKPESVDQFARVAGFYQGLSFLLGTENDGGMAELIRNSDVKDFKLPAHP
jgi:hypothetical protein